MAVDSINRVQPYQISQSSETNDEERRREKDGGDTSKKRRRDKQGEKKFPAPQVVKDEASPVTTELSSQLVDSEKVIELLSHAPKLLPSKNYSTFKSVKKTIPENTDNLPLKKLNKTL